MPPGHSSCNGNGRTERRKKAVQRIHNRREIEVEERGDNLTRLENERGVLERG
jgi:hypothetical protein